MNREFHFHEEVFLEKEEFPSRCKTRIVGYKPNRYLILDLILDHPVTRQIMVKDPVWVYCIEKPVCRFFARVQQIVLNPPLLILEYPSSETAEGTEHRRDERKKIFIRVNCYSDEIYGKRFLFEGYISDVSKSGCLILGDLTQYIDRNIFLSFRVPWTGEEIQPKALVTRCESKDKGIRSGFKFIDLDPQYRKGLDALIDSLRQDRKLAAIIGKQGPESIGE